MPAQMLSTAAPCQVVSTEPWINVTAGFLTTCGIRSGGQLLCWCVLQGSNAQQGRPVWAHRQLLPLSRIMRPGAPLSLSTPLTHPGAP